MKLKKKTSSVEVFGSTGKSTGFKINATGKAFKILSDGLYSDKILAVCRELMCNGHDSHVEAGKPDEPIHIHLPNRLEPWFAVQDYGVGMSDSEIRDLYTTYFASTKEDSNDLVGALGLGSKSPFSYTQSFTVTTVKNGYKGIYSCALDENYEPTVTLMWSTNDCDEPNGVEVKVGVNERDFNDFIDRANRVSSWFDVKPICKSSQYNAEEKAKLLYEDDAVRVTIREHAYGSGRTKFYVKQGQIVYPLEKFQDDLPNMVGIHANNYRQFLEITFKVPLGTTDITASREDLSYDDQSVEDLKSVIYPVAHSLRKKVFADIEAKYDHVREFVKDEAFRSLIGDSRSFTFGELKYDSANTAVLKNLSDSILKFFPFELNKRGLSFLDLFLSLVDTYTVSSERLKKFGRINEWTSNNQVDSAAMAVLGSMAFTETFKVIVYDRDLKQSDKLKLRQYATENAKIPFYVMVMKGYDKGFRDRFLQFVFNFNDELITEDDLPEAPEKTSPVHRISYKGKVRTVNSIGELSWENLSDLTKSSSDSYYVVCKERILSTALAKPGVSFVNNEVMMRFLDRTAGITHVVLLSTREQKYINPLEKLGYKKLTRRTVIKNIRKNLTGEVFYSDDASIFSSLFGSCKSSIRRLKIMATIANRNTTVKALESITERCEAEYNRLEKLSYNGLSSSNFTRNNYQKMFDFFGITRESVGMAPATVDTKLMGELANIDSKTNGAIITGILDSRVIDHFGNQIGTLSDYERQIVMNLLDYIGV